MVIIFFTYGTTSLLASIDDVYIGNSDARLNFCMDFSAFAQYVITIPLLFSFESYMYRYLKLFSKYLTDSYSLLDVDLFNDRLNRLNNILKYRVFGLFSWINMLILVITYVCVWTIMEGIRNDEIDSWHALNSSYTKAGLFSMLISIPITICMIVRWAFICATWCFCIYILSKSRIKVIPSHPDTYGGLGFVNDAHSQFSYLILLVSFVLNITILYKIIIEQSKPTGIGVFGVSVIFYVFIIAFYTLPLSFFSPLLIKAKRNAILAISLQYSNLFAKHNDTENDLLNSQGVIDFQAAFQAIRNMKIMPFDFIRNISYYLLGLFISFVPFIVEKLFGL